MNKHYIFSVIIPVYNTEAYVVETIESVLNQTIGFEENIQLILVNNATEDHSDVICRYYKQKFPNNIVYIELKENHGPNGARKEGLKYASGKYVNFLDSDDKWDKRAFEEAYRFLKKFGHIIPFVACRMKRFGDKNEWGFLDFKFNRTGIVDCLETPQSIQLSLCSCFFNREVFDRNQLDERISHSEDAVFIAQVLLKHDMRYGVASKAFFYYRYHSNRSSAMGYRNKTLSWYFNTPQYGYLSLINMSREKYGYVLPYIQYYLCIELTGRIFEPNTFLALDNEQLERYLILMKTVVSAVDDWVLCSQTYGNRDTKLAELTMKYGEYIFDTLEVIDDWICFRGYKLCSIGDKSNILISDMDINEKIFSVKGRISLPVKINTDVFKLYFAGKETVPLRLDIAEKAANRLCINGICIPKYNFSLAMPLDGNETLVFKLISKDTATTVGFSFVKRAKLSSEIKESFFASEGFVIQSTNNSFSVKKSSSLKYEFALWKKIAKKYSKKVILYRMSLLLLKFFKNPRRESWLFADRILAAGDNADSLFSYVNHLSNPPKTYFVISPESAEYERLRKTGHVIKYGSVKHFLMLGLCDKYLSSNADDPVSILKKHQFLICDCFRYKHIYLQHGIMKDDHSDSLCRFAKGYELITVSTRPEFEMILNGAYGYNSNQIALTGLARYDDLHDESQRKDIPRVILFAPTWRVKLSMAEDIKTGKRPYNKKFIESEYYQFYYNLINDSRLIDVMKENNYIGEFHLHPAFISQSCDFPSNEVISTHLGTTYYPEVFARCSLMITDYSSVCFDFAYMKKPIVFSQFDSETFWQSHTYKQGYFDYERDGFGPVCYDYESTVQAIIDAIERGCTMEEKYKKRVDNFFEYRDDHNCERIYQEILKLDQEKVT